MCAGNCERAAGGAKFFARTSSRVGASAPTFSVWRERGVRGRAVRQWTGKGGCERPPYGFASLRVTVLWRRLVMKIVVIGGSGLIGAKLVSRLREQGHEAVAASRSSGVDTLTGEGLAGALAGA